MKRKNLTKQELKELFPNVVMIEGENESWTVIAGLYAKKFEDFNVTVEEMSNYLGCTTQFVLKYIRHTLKHIIISSAARAMLIHAFQEGVLDPNLSCKGLIMKRILFFRSDWEQFISNLPKIEMYQHIPWAAFEDNPVYQTLKLTIEPSRIEAIIRKTAHKLYGSIVESRDTELGVFPPKLYSHKELKDAIGHKYDVDTFRYLKQQGANKIQCGNLVRYDWLEFKDALPIPACVIRENSIQQVVVEILSDIGHLDN